MASNTMLETAGERILEASRGDSCLSFTSKTGETIQAESRRPVLARAGVSRARRVMSRHPSPACCV